MKRGVVVLAVAIGCTGQRAPVPPSPPASVSHLRLSSKFPPVAAMTHVVAVENDDSATVTFDPVDGARDYRVYPAPPDDDIAVGSDGYVTVRNAIYRCAGDRESPVPVVDDGPPIASDGIRTLVDQKDVGGVTRTKADATLGYVYEGPGPGRVPVYAFGDPSPNGDNSCFFARWAASRVKRYTASEKERADLLATRWRDDGVAFYVPASAAAETRHVYTRADHDARYYFADGAEAAAHADGEAAFLVLERPAQGTVPLMRVFYKNACGTSHDELAPGVPRFERAYKQGDSQPWFSLLWTGITGPTTLVVEALDAGCPFQGHLSPTSIAKTAKHQAFMTIDNVRAASPTGEVFINGQHEADSRPRAIARSLVEVTPRRHPPMDWFADFSTPAEREAFAAVPCGAPDGNCFQTWRVASPALDASFMAVETGEWAMGSVLGELWVTYADLASDVNGKFRMTPRQKATMAAESYLHATMEVDAVTTARRYPQILISDQDAPVQYALAKGRTVIVQTFGDWPNAYQIEVCNHRTWDVNNQCPAYDLYHVVDASGSTVSLAPNDEVGEHASVDHRATFDVYASTKRVYLFLDGRAYGCADMPAAGVPSGPVTVTFGDVLYHSGVDNTFQFHRKHMQVETRRHFDNLGFSSGVTAPSWDESRLPCAAPISL